MAVAIERNERSHPGQAERNGTQAVAPKDPNPAAKRAASDLLDRLYDHGILDLLRAIASGGDDTVTRLATAVNTPGSVQTMRNGLALLSLLSSLDTNLLERLARNASREQTLARAADPEPPGLWTLFKRFTNRDSRRALAAIATVLEGTGRAMDPERSADEPR